MELYSVNTNLVITTITMTSIKKSMFGIGGCEEVTSWIFWAQRREKRHVKGCVAEQKVAVR